MNLETHARDEHKGKSYKPDSGSDATLQEETEDESDDDGSETTDDRDFISEEDDDNIPHGNDKDCDYSPYEESEDDDDVYEYAEKWQGLEAEELD